MSTQAAGSLPDCTPAQGRRVPPPLVLLQNDSHLCSQYAGMRLVFCLAASWVEEVQNMTCPDRNIYSCIEFPLKSVALFVAKKGRGLKPELFFVLGPRL